MSNQIIETKINNPLTSSNNNNALDDFELNEINDENNSRLSINSKKTSQAYLESKRNNRLQSVDLERKGKGPNDYEYRDADDETNDDIQQLPQDFRNSTSITFYQKIRRIGKKTTCMALCLLSFGIAMLITSFVFASRVSNDGFYLFLLIGICAIIPGSYASYHVLGRFFEWYLFIDFIIIYFIEKFLIIIFIFRKGFEKSALPSYDRRLHLP